MYVFENHPFIMQYFSSFQLLEFILKNSNFLESHALFSSESNSNGRTITIYHKMCKFFLHLIYISYLYAYCILVKQLDKTPVDIYWTLDCNYFVKIISSVHFLLKADILDFYWKVTSVRLRRRHIRNDIQKYPSFIKCSTSYCKI